MLERPSFSIVICNYNYGRFLERSIESALAQRYPETEVIVVDDASTDDSSNIIRRYAGRVRPVLRGTNGGQGAAFNTGFAVSEGDVIIFLDADDFLHPEATATIRDNISESVAQYQFRLGLTDAQGTPNGDTYPAPEIQFEEGDLASILLERGSYSTSLTSGLAFSRRVLARILPMDEQAFRQGADGYLTTVAPLYGSVKAIDRVLGCYRQHGQNHSQFHHQLAEQARWRLHHHRARIDALRSHALDLGLNLAPDLELHDLSFLENRVVSLVLAPTDHPYPHDTRRSLWKSARRALAGSKCSTLLRWELTAWWTIVCLAPEAIAKHLVHWKRDPQSRPKLIDRTAKLLRRLLRPLRRA